MAVSSSGMRFKQKQQGYSNTTFSNQNQNQKMKPKQKKQKGKPMPGSMNSSRYLISLSMAVNVFLLTSLVYEKNYHPYRHYHVNGEDSLVNKIRLRQQGAEAEAEAEADGETDRYLLSPFATAQPAYKCHACLTGHNCSTVVSNCTINLDQ